MDNNAATLISGGDDHKEFMQQCLDTNKSSSVDFARTCPGERDIDREEGFASRFYSTCLRGFQQLCRQEQERYAHGSRSSLLKEELDKLYMWGESFGPGELDKALGESEEIRDNVLDLLVNLGELVICALRASSTVARAGQFHELESFIKQARLIMSDVDGEVDLDALASDATCLNRDDYSDDDVHDFREDVVFTIKCLMELGPSLEQNLASAGRSDPLVQDKFKHASKELVKRLGEANWQRYLEVRKMMGDPENNPVKGQETARSVFQPDMTFHDSGMGTSVPARTQYARSHNSFRTSNTEGALRSLRVPPIPVEATNGKSFRCHLCGDMLSTIRTRTQWKMHVFSDLKPYMCTFDECQDKLICFPSRSVWADHEFKEHRFDRYWACPECSARSCSTLDWEHHLKNVHNQKFSGPNLLAARSTACRTSPKPAEEEQCPFCRVGLGKPRCAFVKHVCRHMEDIALMALLTNIDWANIPLPQHIILDERQRSGLGYPDLASKAGEEPLPEESDEPAEEDAVESKNGSDSTEWLRTLERWMSSKDHQFGQQFSYESGRAQYLKYLKSMDPFMGQAEMPVDRELQGLGPQEPVKEREGRGHFLTNACNDCRSAKRKCTHVPPEDSREWVEPTKPLPPLTSSTAYVNSSLPDGQQTTKSTSEATDNPIEPFDIWPISSSVK